MTRSLSIALSIAFLGSSVNKTRAEETDPVVRVTGGEIRGRVIPGGGAKVGETATTWNAIIRIVHRFPPFKQREPARPCPGLRPQADYQRS